MCIKPRPKTRRGWTLVEMMVAVGIFALVGMALMGTLHLQRQEHGLDV